MSGVTFHCATLIDFLHIIKEISQFLKKGAGGEKKFKDKYYCIVARVSCSSDDRVKLD